LRKKHGASVLANCAIGEISAERSKTAVGTKVKPMRICHVINSIKNDSELTALRTVYGNAFYLISVASSIEDRRKALETSIGDASKVQTLVDIDSGEELDYGQKVEDTFPKADFFLGGSGNAGAREKDLKRFLGLICGSSVVTPTAEETAMYFASSAGKRSACLSRQVGASVTSEAGTLLGVGWYDAPAFGGGLYSEGPTDQRCFGWKDKSCHNDLEKKKIAGETVDALTKEKLITVMQPNSPRSLCRHYGFDIYVERTCQEQLCFAIQKLDPKLNFGICLSRHKFR